MFYFVYILESIKGKTLYLGYTTSINKRLREHISGLNFSTKSFRPWQIIHFEGYRNQEDAKRR